MPILDTPSDPEHNVQRRWTCQTFQDRTPKLASLNKWYNEQTIDSNIAYNQSSFNFFKFYAYSELRSRWSVDLFEEMPISLQWKQ